MLGITGTNSNKAHLISGGVLKEGATFTQFSEMVIINLWDRVVVDMFICQFRITILSVETLSLTDPHPQIHLR